MLQAYHTEQAKEASSSSARTISQPMNSENPSPPIYFQLVNVSLLYLGSQQKDSNFNSRALLRRFSMSMLLRFILLWSALLIINSSCPPLSANDEWWVPTPQQALALEECRQKLQRSLGQRVRMYPRQLPNGDVIVNPSGSPNVFQTPIRVEPDGRVRR